MPNLVRSGLHAVGITSSLTYEPHVIEGRAIPNVDILCQSKSKLMAHFHTMLFLNTVSKSITINNHQAFHFSFSHGKFLLEVNSKQVNLEEKPQSWHTDYGP